MASPRPGTTRSQSAAKAVVWSDAAVKLREAKTRESDARTKTLELAYSKEVGAVWQEAHLRPYFARVWSGLRVQLLELPEALAERLNPVDPAAASAVLDEAIRRVLESVVVQLDSYVPPIVKKKPGGRQYRAGKVAKAP